MSDLILPKCAAKAESLIDWGDAKGARAFRRKVGNQTAAGDFLRPPTFAAAGPRNRRALEKLEKRTQAEARIPRI